MLGQDLQASMPQTHAIETAPQFIANAACPLAISRCFARRGDDPLGLLGIQPVRSRGRDRQRKLCPLRQERPTELCDRWRHDPVSWRHHSASGHRCPGDQRSQCTSEEPLGCRSKKRLLELMNDDPFQIVGSGRQDRFRRSLGTITRGVDHWATS